MSLTHHGRQSRRDYILGGHSIITIPETADRNISSQWGTVFSKPHTEHTVNIFSQKRVEIMEPKKSWLMLTVGRLTTKKQEA